MVHVVIPYVMGYDTCDITKKICNINIINIIRYRWRFNIRLGRDQKTEFLNINRKGQNH